RSATAVVMCGPQLYTRCAAPVRLELPDGQKVYYPPRPDGGYCYGYPSSLDKTAVDGTPALEVAFKRDPAGEGAARFDNRRAIQMVVDQQNSTVLATPPPLVTPLPGLGPRPTP